MSGLARRFGPRLLRLQRGIAALEMAFVLPFALVLLPYPMLMARGFWHYTVLQKAAHDAARFMSSASPLDMRNPSRARYAMDVAREMIATTTAGLTTPPDAWNVFIRCDDDLTCNGIKTPKKVHVQLSVVIQDDLFNAITWPLLGDSGWLLQAEVTIPYGLPGCDDSIC